MVLRFALCLTAEQSPSALAALVGHQLIATGTGGSVSPGPLTRELQRIQVPETRWTADSLPNCSSTTEVDQFRAAPVKP